jgi:EamA domain-containing membrane protein RarD
MYHELALTPLAFSIDDSLDHSLHQQCMMRLQHMKRIQSILAPPRIFLFCIFLKLSISGNKNIYIYIPESSCVLQITA